MRNFDTVKRGYDQEQVKDYLDEIINEYEKLLNAKKESDRKVLELSERLEYFKQLENTMNRAIFSAETTSDEIKKVARQEAESLITEAKRNANRIINDALLKAEKASDDADRLKRNVNLLKRRLKSIIEGQLEIIEEMDKIEFEKDEY